MDKKIAVIGAVLENPKNSAKDFNILVAEYKDIIKGRMGIPFENEDISVISLTVVGSLDLINSLTGKIGNLPDVTVKTSISKKSLKSPL